MCNPEWDNYKPLDSNIFVGRYRNKPDPLSIVFKGVRITEDSLVKVLYWIRDWVSFEDEHQFKRAVLSMREAADKYQQLKETQNVTT